ncbi:MAG: rhomboid family intramembrane serine protease [Velocimicrobium sp.]
MKILNKLERKYGKIAIQGLMRYIVIINVLGAILGIMTPGFYYSYLSLDFGQILHGQIWRIVTFVFYPGLSSSSGFVNPMNILFFGVEMYLYYMIGNSLENAWGAFRFNLYYLSGLLLNIVASIILYVAIGSSFPIGLSAINQAMFLAFAVLYPDVQLLLFFVIPIKVKWLGILYGVIIGYEVISYLTIGQYAYALATVIGIANFLIFFLMTRNYKKVSPKQYHRRSQFKKEIKNNTGITRHKCSVCGRTEFDDENLEFRFCSKCNGNYEYCTEHLFTHEHVK